MNEEELNEMEEYYLNRFNEEKYFNLSVDSLKIFAKYSKAKIEETKNKLILNYEKFRFLVIIDKDMEFATYEYSKMILLENMKNFSISKDHSSLREVFYSIRNCSDSMRIKIIEYSCYMKLGDIFFILNDKNLDVFYEKHSINKKINFRIGFDRPITIEGQFCYEIDNCSNGYFYYDEQRLVGSLFCRISFNKNEINLFFDETKFNSSLNKIKKITIQENKILINNNIKIESDMLLNIFNNSYLYFDENLIFYNQFFINFNKENNKIIKFTNKGNITLKNDCMSTKLILENKEDLNFYIDKKEKRGYLFGKDRITLIKEFHYENVNFENYKLPNYDNYLYCIPSLNFFIFKSSSSNNIYDLNDMKKYNNVNSIKIKDKHLLINNFEEIKRLHYRNRIKEGIRIKDEE